MDKEKFETSKETLRKLLAIQQQHTQRSDYRKNESDQVVYERLDGLIADAAADLLAVYADECEEKPMKSEMPCNCDEDYFDDEDDGIAHACIRTAQIKSIKFSDDGVTTINMRHGDPIIFKDISEVMFIS